ncbi:hypothetical protein X801_02246 [Opisthorchis viverrini]|uniref:Uncharacterized protein n=1 Tax=Opisthorchis viverrini TaxID=6198 RepID=A0A1S8X586_OPIVI|nr:hypothetical protein X801_02246 [Opisthorchis viverrini]
MPRTRSGVLNEKNHGEDAIQSDGRQVIRDTHSCMGSSSGSRDSRRSRRSESALLLAELKRSQLQKVLEMQAVRDDDETISAPSRVAIYAEEYRRQHELELSYREPKSDANNVPVAATSKSAEMPVWDDPTKGYLLGEHSAKRNSEWCMAGNHTLAPVTSMDLPRVELTKFDGSSHDYLKFTRQFEFYVESRTTDDRQRLLCLLHYCRGRAREAVEECTVLPPPEAYRHARQILSNLFGMSHCAARSLLDGLHDRFRAFSASPVDLLQLTIKRENCEIALKQKGYEAELNSLSTLERLVRCLPISLQEKWAEYFDGVTKDEREPTFRDLRNFMDIRARISNNCVKFAEFECNERRDVAKGCKVCFRRLKAGQMTKACNIERKCGVNECKHVTITCYTPSLTLRVRCRASVTLPMHVKYQ